MLLTVVKNKKDDETAINPESLGWWFRRNVGRIAGGYKLVRNEEERRWSLVAFEAEPEFEF